MSDSRWRHLESDWEWGLDSPRAERPSPPQVDQTEQPIAGRILGPRGQVLRVVRHGTTRPPFGFTPRAREDRP